MAGKREKQKEERERRIVRAARQLFASRGYRETGMIDIAGRARLAVGTLYNYFPSKPEIALAIVRSDANEAVEAGESILEKPPTDTVEAVAGLFDIYLDTFARNDRALFRETMAASMTNPEGMGKRFFALDLILGQQLIALLAELRERRAISHDTEPGRAALTLYAIFMGWFMVFVAGEEMTFEQFRREVQASMAMAMKGMLAS